MNEMWKELIRRLPQEDAVLVTIVESMGSAPRHAGAVMAIFADGSLLGTVGGGKVEAVCQQRAAEVLRQKADAVEEYNLSDSGKNRLDMACGGAVKVEFCYLAAGEQSAKRMQALAEQQKRNRVLLFGAGHVSRALAALLPVLEFDYVVVDDRPEFAKPEAFAGATAVLCQDMEKAVAQLQVNEDDFIVIMTRGHVHDQEVLREALRTPASYIGLMGSRRKIAMTRALLQEQGFDEQAFARVSTPIGLNIGAETPAEIAISVAAQLIETRASLHKHTEKPLHLIHS